MIIHREIISGTTSSGVYSQNTNPNIRGRLWLITLSPATSSTTYDVSLTNAEGSKFYERLSESGDLSEELDLPINGGCTLAITNATADEAFTGQLWVEN